MTGRPMPSPSPLTAGFWEAARHHQLVVQRCSSCGRFRHYPQHLCPYCLDDGWTWAPVRGTGSVYSYAVTHRAFHPAWTDRVPYAVVTVTLDEGVRMVSDLDPRDTARVAVGLPVQVYFEEVAGTDFTLPRFRLVEPVPLPGDD
ncbi:MAG TPA: OB-fold domain-containing protein [Acidimicrobiales bacterium]|nr:OB-fold domain-containing protein [Acidimicrobiales bacterium]